MNEEFETMPHILQFHLRTRQNKTTVELPQVNQCSQCMQSCKVCHAHVTVFCVQGRREIFQCEALKYSWNKATTSSKSTWDTVLYFALNGLSMILCLWSPLHPLSKLLAIQDHAQNLEEQLWMGGRREVSVSSHRPVTSCDLKQERSFFRRSVSTFLQLVVALDCFIFNKLKIRITVCLLFIKRMLKCFLNCCCTRGLLQENLLCQLVKYCRDSDCIYSPLMAVIPSCAQQIQTCSWAGIFMGFVILPSLLRCTKWQMPHNVSLMPYKFFLFYQS